MVRGDEDGQLYTIEGLSAALIILLTAYLVLGATNIYTPGDEHITDMQLEQLGSDVLAMMDTPDRQGATSDLVTMVYATNKTGFETVFTGYLNETTAGTTDNLNMNATVWYRNSGSGVGAYHLVSSSSGFYTGRDPAVRVTRWVRVPGKPSGAPSGVNSREQAMLVEVLLWR